MIYIQYRLNCLPEFKVKNFFLKIKALFPYLLPLSRFWEGGHSCVFTGPNQFPQDFVFCKMFARFLYPVWYTVSWLPLCMPPPPVLFPSHLPYSSWSYLLVFSASYLHIIFCHLSSLLNNEKRDYLLFSLCHVSGEKRQFKCCMLGKWLINWNTWSPKVSFSLELSRPGPRYSRPQEAQADKVDVFCHLSSFPIPTLIY